MIIIYTFFIGLLILLLYKYNTIIKIFLFKITQWLKRTIRYNKFGMFRTFRRKRKMTEIKNDPDKTACYKMFDFVRIKPAKTIKNKKAHLNETPIENSNESKPNMDTANDRFISGIPKKRSGHRAVCDDKYLYIWGGYSPEEFLESEDEDENLDPETSSSLLPELWRFNFTTKKWCLLKTTGESPDQTVASHCAVLCGNTLLVFGGTGFPFGSILSNSLHTCNLSTLEWKKHKLTGTIPLKLYGSSAVIVNNVLYILFGTTSRVYVCNVYEINLKTFESKKLFDSVELIDTVSFRELEGLNEQYPNQFLAGLYRQEVIHYKSKLYVFGGGNAEGMAYPFDLLPVFDIKTSKWLFVPTKPDTISQSFPERRKFHSCVLVDDYIYVFGGMYADIQLFKPVENCVWRLNMLELKWEKLNTKMPVLTYFHAACVNSYGQIYFHGGVKATMNQTQSRINHLYLFTAKLPKLSEICWNELITKYPNLLNLDKETLNNIGIPLQFINRLF